MDPRPMGPRQPDKRNAAYEQIFGRPTAPPPPVPYPQQGQTPTYHPNHYQTYPEQQRQQYPVYNNQRPHHQYPIQQQYATSTHGHSLAPPRGAPSIRSGGQPSIRAPSIQSRVGPHGAGIIMPRPDEPPDEQHGLTPAQAYQAQVYLNSPAANDADWNRFDEPSGARQAHPGPIGQAYGHPPVHPVHPPTHGHLPRLGSSIEQGDGGLGLDFGADNVSEDSELPWARPGSAASMASFPQRPNANNRASGVPAGARPHPPQIDTILPHTRQSVARSDRSGNTSPDIPTSSFAGTSTSGSSHPLGESPSSSRRSSESARTAPRTVGGSIRRTAADRSMSMSAATATRPTVTSSRPSSTSMSARPTSTRTSVQRPPLPTMLASPVSTRGALTATRAPTSRKSVASQVVYPAMLSRVAEAFRDRMSESIQARTADALRLSKDAVALAKDGQDDDTDRIKDGLAYKDAFDGREAIDKIAFIIKTTDRNLALLLGRALDAQKFFHDVTYDHRLRDSATELYQFKTNVAPYASGDGVDGEEDASVGVSDAASTLVGGSGEQVTTISVDDSPLPSGVFTLLTDCYAPTCSRDRLCYSIACPRRLEQQARLNLKPQPGLKKQTSRESLGDLVEPGTLWVHSVPQEVVDSISDTEKRRQEAINEVMYTERDFVRDMEYLRDVWIEQLKEGDMIPIQRRTDFLEQVFWNIHDIIAVNTRLRDALTKRQKSAHVVERIGDILFEAVPHFSPFVSYGAHQLYGKYEFEKEKSANEEFAKFVETTERLPESRKLELNGYLTKPTTRLARYPLLLQAVLKSTPEDNPDFHTLPKVIDLVRGFLTRVNVETGKTENRFNLLQLDQQLVFRPAEHVDLRLKDDGRELVYKGALSKRGNAGIQGDSGDLQVFLFDHAVLMVKQKTKHEQFKVYRRPIPLELLLISATDEGDPKHAKGKSSTLTRKTSFTKTTNGKAAPYVPAFPVKPDGKGGFSITFVHLGRKYYQITLWASTYVSQQKWVENITKQQEAMRERSGIFDTVLVSEKFFFGPNKVNCAAPFGGGRRIVYGTDDGVYLSDLRDPHKNPVKVLELLDVEQVDLLEEYQLLIVLSERQVITFPLDALDARDPMAGLKRAKRISSHTTFFKAGICLGKVLVCIVKSSPLSSTIKTLEPIDQNVRGRSKPTFRKLLQGGNDTLKLFREFYIPVESSSIHFLKTKLCVGCSKGFEIVDLETLDTQGLLDHADESLEFIRKRDNLRPMAIYRIDNEFLLCYDEFAFYVNRNGWRSRKEFMLQWEGAPTGFALHYPYVLAFEPSFVEIRNVETGALSQVIQGSNLRLLFADTPPSTTNTAATAAYQQGYAPGNYGSPASYGGRSSMGGYGGQPHMAPPSVHQHPQGRDEILMVSDDRILTLRTAMLASDAASMMSMPR